MPEEERRTTLVKHGDKLIPLGERLDLLERRITIQTLIVTVLVVDHISTLPVVMNFIFKLFGL